MTLSLVMITFDSENPGPLAKWWATQVGGAIEKDHEGWFYTVGVPGVGYKLAFQKVVDPTPGKNRVHLDFIAPELDSEVLRLTSAGATEVLQQNMNGFRWVILADPEGNQFCVSGG
ncbi:MAG: VOC family protein [Mycobacteriaceae bacterium]